MNVLGKFDIQKVNFLFGQALFPVNVVRLVDAIVSEGWAVWASFKND